MTSFAKEGGEKEGKKNNFVHARLLTKKKYSGKKLKIYCCAPCVHPLTKIRPPPPFFRVWLLCLWRLEDGEEGVVLTLVEEKKIQSALTQFVWVIKINEAKKKRNQDLRPRCCHFSIKGKDGKRSKEQKQINVWILKKWKMIHGAVRQLTCPSAIWPWWIQTLFLFWVHWPHDNYVFGKVFAVWRISIS